MEGFYVYDEQGDNIAYVRATDILEAYKEAEAVTGINRDELSVERSDNPHA
jgi:hypothetical protein